MKQRGTPRSIHRLWVCRGQAGASQWGGWSGQDLEQGPGRAGGANSPFATGNTGTGHENLLVLEYSYP